MTTHPVFASTESTDLAAFASVCEQHTILSDYPHAADTQRNVLIYDGEALRAQLPRQRRALLAELHTALSGGPGVVVIRHGFADTRLIDRQTAVFEAILAAESQHGVAADHFAKAGANARIWNALQKSALLNPAAFVDYYANPLIDLVSEAWLGPAYQMTAQVNVVRPGGDAQQPHRDYHLGFQSDDAIRRFPMAVQRLSPYLTLQGAVVHSDMPLASGPTLLLPYSQQYDPGYLAWRQPAFRDYFQAHHVQLPLTKGDLLFFNPALFHAAGSNTTTDIHRIANLLQVSSAFGKTMETIDHSAIMAAVYPVLLAGKADGRFSDETLRLAINMVADGYSFPTNLDRSPPIGGLAPQTGQQLLQQALDANWSPATFEAAKLAYLQARLA